MQPPGPPNGPPGPPYPPPGSPQNPYGAPPGQPPAPPGGGPFRSPWGLSPEDPAFEKRLTTYAVPGSIVSGLSALVGIVLTLDRGQPTWIVTLGALYVVTSLLSLLSVHGKQPSWPAQRKVGWALFVGAGTMGYVLLVLAVVSAILAVVFIGLVALACGRCR